MPATISLLYASTLTVTNTLTGDYIASGDNTFSVNGMNETGTLTASTGVPVTKQSSGQITMSGGAGELNLAALLGATADETVVGTGLKVQAIKFRNKSTNANTITVAEGASNGYALLGAFTMTLQPGQSVTILGNDATPDVASGDRIIDITGTGSQILEYQVVLG